MLCLEGASTSRSKSMSVDVVESGSKGSLSVSNRYNVTPTAQTSEKDESDPSRIASGG